MPSDTITREANRVSVPRMVWTRELRRMLALIHQAHRERGYVDIVLDFSGCEAATETAMLPLLPVLAAMRDESAVQFELVEPRNEALKALFHNANWSHFISPDVYDRSSYRGRHIPAQQFSADDLSGQLQEDILSLVLSELNVDRDSIAAVEWSLTEIMDNVVNHALSPVGGFVQASAFDMSNRVEFVVADAGVGIPQSIGIHDPQEALMQAIAEGVTRDSTENAGNGLFGSYRVASLSSGGQFEINSGNGVLYFDQHREDVQTRNVPIPYNGTAVRCGIGLGQPDLLQTALRFQGKVHQPVYDVVERRFERESGEVVFAVKTDARGDIGSRHGGRRVRQVLENLLRDHQVVTVDFEGVGVISSSFADEVFGRLFVDLGPRAFMTRIEIKSAGTVVDGLIDRAIQQRVRLGNGNSQ